MILRGLRLSFLVAFCTLALMGTLSWVLAIAACGLSLVAICFDTLWEKTQNRDDLAEIAFTFDVIAIAIALGGSGYAESLGFLAIAPMALRWPTIRNFCDRASVTTGSFVLLAGWAETVSVTPSMNTILQSVGVTTFGLLGNYAYAAYGNSISSQTRIPSAMSLKTKFETIETFRPSQTLLENIHNENEMENVESEPDFFELREQLRTLQEEHTHLQNKSMLDQIKVRLIDWRLSDERNVRRLANDLREVLQISAVTIYTVPDARQGMVFAGSSGETPPSRTVLDIPLQVAPIIIREKAEDALRSLIDSKDRAMANTVLIDKGRVVAMVALYDSRVLALDKARIQVDHLASFIARLIADSGQEASMQTRANQAELLADLSQRMSEMTGPNAASALVGDLIEALKLDGCAIWNLTGETPDLLVSVGTSPIDSIQLPEGNGIEGWAKSGGKELVAFDVRSDDRFNSKSGVRGRNGMLVVMPLRSSGSLIGALVATSNEAHGIAAAALGALRSIVPNTVKRIFGGFASNKPGLVDATTFWENSQGPGSFVEVDLGSEVGSDGSNQVELRKARRKLLAATMSRLPEGGLISRRESGTLIVFLSGFDESAAHRWAIALDSFADKSMGMGTCTLALRAGERDKVA